MSRIVIALSFLVTSIESLSQIDTFIDPRDGQRYETIIIENKKWFREHLRYQTKLSFCPKFTKNPSACLEGNYYLNSELDSICPAGWRIPTVNDWNDYMKALYATNNIELDSTRSATFPPPNNTSSATFKNFDILKQDTLLKLTAIGWVEGNKQQNKNSLTLWVNDKLNKDAKFHVHLGKYGVIKHTHDHHIVDKPKKIRKFAARCVCEVSDRPALN